MENRKRKNQIKFYADDFEKSAIQNKVLISNLKQNDYLLKCALDKDIIVIDNLDELINQLVRIGNNLNQLTKLSHQGKIINAENELNEIKGEFEKVWQQLRQLRKKPQAKQD